MFGIPVVYIQVHSGHMIGRRLDGSASVRLQSSALAHPRTLMGDFLAIAKLFRQLLSELKSGGFSAISPKVVVHLVPHAEGGYTNVEERAFLEAAKTGGARTAKVAYGPAPLTDAQVRDAFR